MRDAEAAMGGTVKRRCTGRVSEVNEIEIEQRFEMQYALRISGKFLDIWDHDKC